MKRLVLAALAATALSAAANAATFTGKLYASYYEDPQECDIWDVFNDSSRNSIYWRDEFVEVDGKKEPARLGCDEYAYPVTIAPGETFTAEVVHGSSTDAHIKFVQVLSDAAMYNRYKNTEEDGDTVKALWPRGATQNTRAWILVALNNVTTGPTYTLDFSKAPIVNDPDATAFYNPADEDGGPSSRWTVADYAAAFGVDFTGTVELTESVNFDVKISETGEQFGQRVWCICDPFETYSDKLNAIDDKGGDEELIDCNGLYFVTADMVAELEPDPTAPQFTGELYASYWDAEDECAIWQVIPSIENTTFWLEDFVEVNGKKEPARWGSDEFVYPVTITPGATFSAEIVHETSTAAHFKAVQVLSDEQMYNRYKKTGGDDRYWVNRLWPNGAADETRAWVLVILDNVYSGPTYTLDFSETPIVNDPDAKDFYNPKDGDGKPSSTWTATEYAAAFGVDFSGTTRLTKSAAFDVKITETGKAFGRRVWNVCDPFRLG